MKSGTDGGEVLLNAISLSFPTIDYEKIALTLVTDFGLET